ncbi:MAG: hypothetical protein MJZ68_03145 [archaeon]|nr:hypothetical protein [archaeon]
MNHQDELSAITAQIKEGSYEKAGPLIMELASKCNDEPMTLLTCASMLKTIGDDRNFPGVVDVIMSHIPEDKTQAYEIASGFISLGCLKDAGKILADLEPNDKVHRARAAVYHGLDRHDDALAEIGMMETLQEIDRVLKVQVLGSLGQHDKAIADAEELLKRSDSYRAGRSYISALVLAGKNKEAAKYAKDRLKGKDADGYALMAWYQWLNNNSTAAGAYSSKCLKLANSHLGALETIGYSFADKGTYWEAKVAAGAINEIEPGSPAVFRILAMCRKQ